MGIFDAITGAVVMSYKVETDAAKAKIKELSGEQKKAAKEAAEALEKQGKAAESMAAQYAKGSAIIVGGFLAARDGLKHMREEARLTAGSAGVNIDALSDSWDGLKTRMDLLTLAQAGHRGAWKLTTGQIQLVSEGMRALEAKGYDTERVFEKFTEVMKKGKLEGLDDFGLSLQATGDQTKDLQVLMNALGREVADVGGNFDKTGDSAQRSIVKMENGLSRLRSAAGLAAEKFLDLGVAIGDALGQLVYGDLAEATGPAGLASSYADRFRSQRGPVVGGNVTGRLDRAGDWLGLDVDRQLFAGTQDEDRQAGKTLSNFSGNVRRSMDGKGPLATKSPEEFAAIIAGLPKDWEKVDARLAAQVNELDGKLRARFAIVGGKAADEILTGFTNALSANRDRNKKKPRASGGGTRNFSSEISWTEALTNALTTPDEEWMESVFPQAAQAGAAVGNYAMGAASAAEARGRQRRQDEIDQQRFEASMEQNRRFAVDLAGTEADSAAADRESFLERTFGKLEEFDAYASAFSSLSAVGTAAWGALYETIVSGEGNLGAAVRKAVAAALGAKAQEFGAEGFMTLLRGAAYTAMGDPRGPGTMAAGGAMMAGAVAVGALASALGGGGTSTMNDGSTGSRGGRYQDHRGGGPGMGQPGASNIVVVPVGTYDDESRRYRERQVYSAITRVQASYRPAEGTS